MTNVNPWVQSKGSINSDDHVAVEMATIMKLPPMQQASKGRDHAQFNAVSPGPNTGAAQERRSPCRQFIPQDTY